MTRAFVVRGPEAALVRWLDVVHVRCDVAGIIERDGCRQVWLAAGSPPLPAVAELRIERMPEAATADWRQGDDVVLVADDLIVRPPWVARPEGFGGIDLVVPRGMAFGSGEHESTQLALRALHSHLPGPGSFADIGTGSGILALYATQRQCSPVVACDLDAAAVHAAAELVPSATIARGGPDALFAHGPVDNVVANMTAGELLGCLASLRALWRGPGHGMLVLSGVRRAERDEMVAVLEAEPHDQVRGSDFVALVYL